MQRSSQCAGSGFRGVDELRWRRPQCRRIRLRCTRQHRCLYRKLPQKQRPTRMILSLSLSLVLSLFFSLFFFPKNPNIETAELAGLGTRTYRCRGEHQRSAELHGRLQLPERKEKQQWKRLKKQKKKEKGGKKKRKKHGENKNGSCRSSTSFFCPQQRFRNQENGTNKRRAEEEWEARRWRKSFREELKTLRGRRRDEDDGGDDVRTFSSAFSRLPFVCDVAKFF